MFDRVYFYLKNMKDSCFIRGFLLGVGRGRAMLLCIAVVLSASVLANGANMEPAADKHPLLLPGDTVSSHQSLRGVAGTLYGPKGSKQVRPWARPAIPLVLAVATVVVKLIMVCFSLIGASSGESKTARRLAEGGEPSAACTVSYFISMSLSLSSSSREH